MIITYHNVEVKRCLAPFDTMAIVENNMHKEKEKREKHESGRTKKKSDPEFYRKLLALLIPMVVQNLMNALVSASDALMVGTLDQNSLSAVSLATQISFVLNLFYAAITIGTTVMVVYFLLNLDEMIKLPAVYRHYKKYQWVNNITREDTE